MNKEKGKVSSHEARIIKESVSTENSKYDQSSLQGINTFGMFEGKKTEKCERLHPRPEVQEEVMEKKRNNGIEGELCDIAKILGNSATDDGKRNKEKSVIEVVSALLSVRKGVEITPIHEQVSQNFSTTSVLEKRHARRDTKKAKTAKETRDKKDTAVKPRAKRLRRKSKRLLDQTSFLDAQLRVIEEKEKLVLGGSAEKKNISKNSRLLEIEKIEKEEAEDGFRKTRKIQHTSNDREIAKDTKNSKETDIQMLESTELSNDTDLSRDKKVSKGTYEKIPKKGTSSKKKERVYTCPHCNKTIGSRYGFKYHIDNMVCRTENMERNKATRPSIGKRKRSPNGSSSTKKRFRGTKEDRTCPHCKVEFSSVLGRDYHVQHMVCYKEDLDKLGCTIAFPTLVKGSKFVTKFGIVEVIADDRGESTYRYPHDIKNLSKNHTTLEARQIFWIRRSLMAFAFYARLRRSRLTRIYEYKNINAETTQKAYFGAAIQRFDVKPCKEILPKEQRLDPMHPAQALPDRIVYCKLVPDERKRIKWDKASNIGEQRKEGNSIAASLYLRRRDLTRPYNPMVNVYICPGCGAHFTSKDGFKYHTDNEVCYKKSKLRGQQRKEDIESTEVRISRHYRRNTTRDRNRRQKVQTSVYPQLWIYLGFKIPAATKGKTKPPKREREEKKDYNVIYDVKNMSSTLESLTREWKTFNKRDMDHKLGALYPWVYKSLGFIDPNIAKMQKLKEEAEKRKRGRRKRIAMLNRKILPKRRRRKRDREESNEAEEKSQETEDIENQEIMPVIPPGPIYDLQVLIDEVMTGRYPSISRYHGPYPAVCNSCKEDDGELLKCNFCDTAIHLECALEKLSFKVPEPGDEFVCNSCARKIIARRNRAEKRRLKKEAAVRQRYQGMSLPDDGENTEEETKVEKPTVEIEYEVAAAVGRELSELLELLGDARNRLNQMSSIMKFNNLRRSQIEQA